MQFALLGVRAWNSSVGYALGLTSPRASEAQDRPWRLDNSCHHTESWEIYAVLLYSAPDAMVISDQEGRILQVNAEAKRQFGYLREELIGKAVEKLIPVRFRDIHQRHRATSQSSSSCRSMKRGQEIVIRRKDGSKFAMETSQNAVQTQNGTVFYSILRNWSELEKAYAASNILLFNV